MGKLRGRCMYAEAIVYVVVNLIGARGAAIVEMKLI